jgi:hypothetical protein
MNTCSAFFCGSRFAHIGGEYNFDLHINSSYPMTYITKVTLELYPYQWSWNGVQHAPFSLHKYIQLPTVINSWSPKFTLEGYSEYLGIQSSEFNFPAMITTTNVEPIYDARLACSNSPADQWKINPIRDCLGIWGFDCSTLGREVMSSFSSGPGLLESEKIWAEGGDCFIGLLTSRDISAHSGKGLPPAWPHTESGLTYSKDKPIMAFLENGARADALYQNLDDNHIIEFNPSYPYNDLNLSRNKIQNFREECSRYRSKKSIDGVVNVATTTCAVIGAATIIGYVTNKLF